MENQERKTNEVEKRYYIVKEKKSLTKQYGTGGILISFLFLNQVKQKRHARTSPWQQENLAKTCDLLLCRGRKVNHVSKKQQVATQEFNGRPCCCCIPSKSMRAQTNAGKGCQYTCPNFSMLQKRKWGNSVLPALRSSGDKIRVVKSAVAPKDVRS